MRVADFDYQLPDDLIARHPAALRSGSRLLVLDGRDGAIQHRAFRDLVDLLAPGDLLVFNNTRVIPARLFGRKETGGAVEILIERIMGDNHCALAQVRSSKPPKPGSRIVRDDGSMLVMRERQGEFFLLDFAVPVAEVLLRIGHMPLPPYIDRADTAFDRERYQTVYAEKPGAVAAPTAGLHFDREILAALAQKGVRSTAITLHVGAGTFQPVRVENVAEHRMHAEFVEVDADTVRAVAETKAVGRRVVAVGTTSVRALESAALFSEKAGSEKAGSGKLGGVLQPLRGDTDIFITPGYRFRVVDALLTNFHLPKSTLLMLVSAFAGQDHTLHAYYEAVRERYRFFSYGDAMFIPYPHMFGAGPA